VCAKLVPDGVPARALVVGIGCLVLTLVASDAAHRLVEQPFIRLGRQWSARPSARRPVSALTLQAAQPRPTVVLDPSAR
jgi:peptidoglycan/LPS O-acetylase OafA/YrhL